MQVIVQRLLAAKSLSHAQGATVLAAVIKILPLFMMVMPGMISRIKFPGKFIVLLNYSHISHPSQHST